MTAARWSADQLGALADEWVAEREAFKSGLQTYLTTQLAQTAPTPPPPPDLALYDAELAAIGERLCGFLQTLDSTPWYAVQHRLAEYQATLETQFATAARADAARLASLQPPAEALARHEAIRQALVLLQYIVRIYQELQGQVDVATRQLANRLASQMKYRLYPVRQQVPALQRYWLLDNADPAASAPAAAGAHPCSGLRHYYAEGPRGAYTCYVPEYYQADRDWPLLLTLHGASGNDEDFIWTWLTYARSRGYLLVSAKAFGPTWFPWDAPSLLHILDEVQARYRVDPRRILLTGLSDGGSFSYEVGFSVPERFSGLAVVAGILRPHLRSPQASQLPVYVLHGDRDQLFPVAYVRLVVEKLREWGHHVTYRELPGFGHAYPPGENAAILTWFAGLRGPEGASGALSPAPSSA